MKHHRCVVVSFLVGYEKVLHYVVASLVLVHGPKLDTFTSMLCESFQLNYRMLLLPSQRMNEGFAPGKGIVGYVVVEPA